MIDKALSIKNLRVRLPDASKDILEGVSFDIAEGDWVYIVGGNGSGKTTLVKTILGLVEKEQGEIEIFGEQQSQDIISKNFGYVPQHNTIDRSFPMSVREMIELECRNSKTKCTIPTDRHLEYFDSQHLIDKEISDLSGGEFQKVLIARALVTHPRILILDEPTNNLDERSRKVLFEILADINEKDKTTIIIVTHEHDLAEGQGRRILEVFEKGVRPHEHH